LRKEAAYSIGLVFLPSGHPAGGMFVKKIKIQDGYNQTSGKSCLKITIYFKEIFL